MKKIGIICNYYVRNFGSVLQSYALYKYLINNYDNVRVIKYIPVNDLRNNIKIKIHVATRVFANKKTVLKKLKSIFDKKSQMDFQKIRYKRGLGFDNFIKKYITNFDEYRNITELQKHITEYSDIILGSDQLWGLSDMITDYHTLSFVPDTVKKSAYGTSFGVSSLPKYFKNIAKVFLPRFDYLSARETTGANIIKEITNQSVTEVVDPVLLLNKSDWNEIAGNEKKVQDKYIFSFFLGNNKEHRKTAEKLKHQTGYKIVSIQQLDEYVSGDEKYADYVFNDASPSDFLNLIKNAEFVITDSFHATVFSIIFEKQFCTLYRYAENDKVSKNTRIDSLLNKLALSDRCLHDNNILYMLDKKIDYEEVSVLKNKLVKQSKEYIALIFG